jgi:glycosyltransferase involved in cell wall biosynthesis
MRGLRIALLIRSLETGGSERQVALLARGLRERGHDVRLLTFYDGGTLREGIESGGVAVASLGKKGRWDVVPFLIRFVGAVGRLRPDVLYSFLPTANLLTLLLKIRYPSLPLVWGVRSASMNLAHYDRLSRYSYAAERLFLGLPDLVIANSNAAVHALGARRRIDVVPNGIDIDRFRPDAGKRAEMRSRLGVGAGQPLVGIVGRLDPIKDHETFLRAARAMVDRGCDAKFVIAGDGEGDYRRRLEQLANELGISDRVAWVGEIGEIERLYPALDVLISSSESEGFPNALAEAMASGVPCVATEVGDSRAIVGACGEMAAVRDWTGIAAAAQRVMQAPLGVESREWIVRNFSVTAMLERTEALLSSVRRHARSNQKTAM